MRPLSEYVIGVFLATLAVLMLVQDHTKPSIRAASAVIAVVIALVVLGSRRLSKGYEHAPVEEAAAELAQDLGLSYAMQVNLEGALSNAVQKGLALEDAVDFAFDLLDNFQSRNNV